MTSTLADNPPTDAHCPFATPTEMGVHDVLSTKRTDAEGTAIDERSNYAARRISEQINLNVSITTLKTGQ